MSTKQTDSYWSYQESIRDQFYNVLCESIEEAEQFLQTLTEVEDVDPQTYAECKRLYEEELKLEDEESWAYDRHIDNELQDKA